MTPKDFVGYVALLSLLMAVIAVIERIVPLKARSNTTRAPVNLSLSLLTLALNWFLMTATAVIALPERGFAARLPLPLAIAVSVVALDFFTYAAHWSMHRVPFLWRFHRVHHSDTFVDVTTTLRQHPVEGLWRYLWILAGILLFGLPAAGVVVYRLVSVLNALFEHANIHVPLKLDRLFSAIWVTPNVHKVHHSRDVSDTDSNYGNIFSVYDRLFGTFTGSDRAREVSYGL